MTLEEFVDALRKTPRDWRLEEWRPMQLKKIRRGSGDDRQCPLHAVAGTTMKNALATAQQALGMEQEESWKIVDAADGSFYDVRTELVTLRAQLLEACGLKEAV